MLSTLHLYELLLLISNRHGLLLLSRIEATLTLNIIAVLNLKGVYLLLRWRWRTGNLVIDTIRREELVLLLLFKILALATRLAITAIFAKLLHSNK